jgi:malate dehydrogenase (oxaloacetate-decarboxylating)
VSKISEKELLAKARKPSQDAMKLHPFYKGKIEVALKAPVRSYEDFAVWYTPGVAEPCKAIEKDPAKVYEMTNKWNAVAVVSNGTRVLGLGNIGPKAALPVMEGKALLFKYLGGVDAYPICLDCTNIDDLVSAVKWIQPSFGGVNLEDIEQPLCFDLLNRLKAEAEIPIWHDDQQGTATIMLAGMINALKLVGKTMDHIQVAILGAGAAGICTARLLFTAGVKPENSFMVDSKGLLHSGRTDLKERYPQKWEICLKTNSEGRTGGIEDALKGSDAVVSMATPGPGVIKPEWVKGMANDSIVFAAANPVPEIWPWEAKEAGAKIVATGRSDFPNQVNNSLGFPGIFRGVLDVRATTITDSMCIAAAEELAKTAEDSGINENRILPSMDDREVYPKEAVAVALKAMEEGVAQLKLSRRELYDKAASLIERARKQTEMMMNEGLIPKASD